MPEEGTRVIDKRARSPLPWRLVLSQWRRFAGGSGSAGSRATSGWRAEGAAGLQSRARLTHPQAVPTELREACLAVRRTHPTWGPVKVRAWLERRDPQAWPAASAIGALVGREGLTVKRRRRRAPPGLPTLSRRRRRRRLVHRLQGLVPDLQQHPRRTTSGTSRSLTQSVCWRRRSTA